MVDVSQNQTKQNKSLFYDPSVLVPPLFIIIIYSFSSFFYTRVSWLFLIGV